MTEWRDRKIAATLSVVIPVYNELDTWREIVGRVVRVELPGVAKQVILVDDGSSDGTREQLRDFAAQDHADERTQVKVVFHDRNQGKGAALRTGFGVATGDVIIVQDADLEYDPAEYGRLIQPILDGEADVVYGSRFATGGRKGPWKSYLANRFLTALSNRMTGLSLTDMETCYKVFRPDVLRRVHLEQNRFGFEPEITAKIARLGVRIRELPIRYTARGRDKGKKIGWKDGVRAIWCILAYSFGGGAGAGRTLSSQTGIRTIL